MKYDVKQLRENDTKRQVHSYPENNIPRSEIIDDVETEINYRTSVEQYQTNISAEEEQRRKNVAN